MSSRVGIDYQSPGEDKHGGEACPRNDAGHHEFQPLCLD